MYLRMLQRANFLLIEYSIFDFPIPLHIIDQIIHDLNIKIAIRKYLTSSISYSDEIVIGIYEAPQYREELLHETCHICYHCGNKFDSDKYVIAKNEAQAQAFAAYFLMPVYIFESDLRQGLNDYELSENFGVCLKFVRYRKTLTEALLSINYFKGDETMWKDT